MDNGIYQHFRKDEAPFIDRMTDLMTTAATEYRPVVTEFLDPRQNFIIHALNRDDQIELHEFGGYDQAEQKRVIIAPDYFEPTPADFGITPIKINYPEKFAELKHGQILGTIANLGIDRDVFGDIITDGRNWQLFVTSAVADFVVRQTDHVGKIKVRLEKIDFDRVITPIVAWESENLVVSSPRLDAVVADVFNVSRQRTKTMIEAGQVKVNWRVMDKPDYDLDQLDMISVRHYGRFQIMADLGQTRKEKIRLQIRTLRK
ncbi:hypothetical protein FC83_GL002517 [Agrilactobacillus composti DSM 18527 = JCM 14202]|uniref:RNA-binding S4 domain-containing protein n=1 Tax=Agrilactobacillus composti DSM 18527 = JCM 14202 TaxID=1423734 RepID=A0A0R1YC61_9LACO|nr:RNA-binding protein [Agrilactobacillus composti]KRM36643.1 hypothetical protein FC83_GL002517 [Agrilactobacillus composti DSM 18527 = JCM 14202]